MLEELEVTVKFVKEKIRRITDDQLPTMIEAIGLGDELPLANGTKLVIKREHGASPLKDNREKVWDWMEENEHGHLVKRTLSIAFGKDEQDGAAELRSRLASMDYDVDDVRKVESQTLSKFVRDAQERGETIPEELFGVYRTAKAKITGKPTKHFAGE